MVDIIDLHRKLARVAFIVLGFPFVNTVTQIDQVTDDLEDIFLGQGSEFQGQLQTQLMVQLETSDGGKIVTLLVEEQTGEERIRTFYGRRITGAQAPVDLDLGFLSRGDLVQQQGIPQVGTDEKVVDEQNIETIDAALGQFFELGSGQLFIALDHDLAGRFIDNINRSDLTGDILFGDLDKFNLLFFNLTNRRLGELAVGLDQDLAIGIDHFNRGTLPEKQLGVDLLAIHAIFNEDFLSIVKVVQQLLS